MFQVVWFLKFCKIIFLSKENRIEVSLFFKLVLKFQSYVYFEAKNIINLKWREIKEFSRGFIGNLIVFMIKIHRRQLKLELWAPFLRKPSDKCRSSLGPFSERFVQNWTKTVQFQKFQPQSATILPEVYRFQSQ